MAEWSKRPIYNTPVTPDWHPYCVLTATQTPEERSKDASGGRGRREDAQNAINQDAGVTGRRKTEFLHWRPYYDNQKFTETQFEVAVRTPVWFDGAIRSNIASRG
ncbi:hypothetical protein DPMN_121524 [Dreissena polymorpha]|uniref:Uncharacterized protein n=1 Tax=Dreissena polymorpha TaxID=45954 RepID=A0A9D4GQW0_DREPO|nr:hypothetical protein DPMN_121524 [Dreissena polymorpha]